MALFTMRDSWNVWRRKVNAAIGNVEEIDADEIIYDNTTSGLTATNVQSAIDEVVSGVGSLDGGDIAYDGTTSGLSATSVQGAIDEVDGTVDNLGTDVNALKEFNTNIPAGYLLIGRLSISDTVENGTYSDCLDTIAAHLKTVASALEDDEIIITDSLTITGNVAFMVKPEIFTNQSTITNMVGMSLASNTTTYYMWDCIAYSGSGTSTMQHMTYSGGTWSFYNDGPNSAGASKTVSCTYIKFKKIK